MAPDSQSVPHPTRRMRGADLRHAWFDFRKRPLDAARADQYPHSPWSSETHRFPASRARRAQLVPQDCNFVYHRMMGDDAPCHVPEQFDPMTAPTRSYGVVGQGRELAGY